MTDQRANRRAVHLQALRAAAAVTGRARQLGRPALCAAVATHMLACSGNKPASKSNTENTSVTSTANTANTTSTSTAKSALTRNTTGNTAGGVVNNTTNTTGKSAESCITAAGTTDLKCCIRTKRAAKGCQLCSEPFVKSPPTNPACLSCSSYMGAGGGLYSECCSMFRNADSLQRAGCSPWGPSAPPEWSGRTLAMFAARFDHIRTLPTPTQRSA